MCYDPESTTTEAITLDADYQGWRIRFQGLPGNARVPMQVDVGIGDVVYPAPIWIDYPVLLDQPAPHLLVYTPENAIAEKYQAIVELDMANSRMKDFHDIWTLVRNLEFDGERLSESIRKTFERRKTELPSSVPTAFTSGFYNNKTKEALKKSSVRAEPVEARTEAGTKSRACVERPSTGSGRTVPDQRFPKQTQWQAFLGKGLATKESLSLAEVTTVLRNFLMSPTEALVSGEAFRMRWGHNRKWGMIDTNLTSIR